MSVELGLPPTALEQWITGMGLDVTPPLTLVTLGHGQSNLTSSVTDADGRKWVLRRPPLGHLLASAHDVAREHRIMAGLAGTGVPVPTMLGLTTELTADGAAVVLMENVDGRAINETAAAELTPDQRRAVGSAMASALAAVHSVDLEATGLIDLASHKPYAARQIKRWRHQLEGSRTRPLPIAEDLAERLARGAPTQSELSLVHGDFHVLNVLFDRREPRVRAIVDWELCTLGEPIADLGGLLAFWPSTGDPLSNGPFSVSTLAGFPTRSEVVDAYAQASGRDVTDVAYWESLACWKVAIIFDGVIRRGVSAADEEHINSSLVDGLLERSLALADAAGLR